MLRSSLPPGCDRSTLGSSGMQPESLQWVPVGQAGTHSGVAFSPQPATSSRQLVEASKTMTTRLRMARYSITRAIADLVPLSYAMWATIAVSTLLAGLLLGGAALAGRVRFGPFAGVWRVPPLQ